MKDVVLLRWWPCLLAALILGAGGCRRQRGPAAPTDGGANPPAGDGAPVIVSPHRSIPCDIKGGTTAVDVSSDGSLVIVQGNGDEKNVQIWDVGSQKMLHAFDNRSGSVLPVAMAPDGKTAAYGTYSHIVQVDVQSGKELRRLTDKEGPFGFPRGLCYSPAGDLIVVASGRKILAWDSATGEQRWSWNADEKEVTSLSGFFDQGRKIAVGGEKGAITVWDTAQGKPIQTVSKGSKDKITAIAVTSDGKTLAAAEIFDTIKVWDPATGRVLRALDTPGMSLRVDALLFLKDGKTLVYPDQENDLILEDSETGKVRARLHGHTENIWSIALAADGSTLYSGGGKTINVWDLKPLK
jgi:WD40 repeat protein